MTAPLHRVRNYEDLDGAQGREVFFRPHRYRASDLAPLACQVLIEAGGVSRICPLLDVSQNGVAIQWPENLTVSTGENLDSVAVRFDEHDGYRGEAKVGSVRDADGVRVVGLSFAGFSIAIEDILHLRTIKAFAAGAPVAQWRVHGQEQFKILVSELALRLEDASLELGRLEASLPWHVLNGEDSVARQALMQTIRNGIAAETLRAMEEIDRVVRSAPPSHSLGLREYSRRHLHDFFMQAPAAHRAYHKPFGYPGDYEVMRFLYEKPFEGATLFAKAMSLAVHETASSRAVRHRKDLLKRRLRELIENQSRPARVLAIASGPAQELYELLREGCRPAFPLEIVLFDQDKEALGYAFRRLRPFIEGDPERRVRIVYLHESIKRLLRDSNLYASFAPFDFIYSAGLFDYLRHSTCVQLTRDLHARLREGGTLLVANMVPENPSRWFMEHHLDWQLVYRTHSELLDIARAAAPAARSRILEEESGVNPFAELVSG